MRKHFFGIGLVFLLGACGLKTPTPSPIVSDAPIERLFLQQITSTAAIVKWRGGSNRICYAAGETFDGWDDCIEADLERAANGGTHRIVRLQNLKPDERYYYSVNGRHVTGQHFSTAPPRGSVPDDGNTRLWILGDSGMTTFDLPPELAKAAGITEQALATMVEEYRVGPPKVRDGLLRYLSATEDPDVLLLLGDNAYLDGNDKQWQQAFFELYAGMLKRIAVWPTIGNHEMGAAHLPGMDGVFMGGVSTSSDPDSYVDIDEETVDKGLPYLDIFTLPAQGESGGVASGTEQYYSFDYANVHVVSLDSQLSILDPAQRDKMKDWLTKDLKANQQDCTVVIFHHPPYSKGSHNSDEAAARAGGLDLPIIYLRKEFTPIFEQYGVDLVYSGHSHAYERSWYLKGHRGDAASFDALSHAELSANCLPSFGQGSEAYHQVTASGEDYRVVYIVAGASGKASAEGGTLDHPAHVPLAGGRHGLETAGAVVLDAGRYTLTSSYVDTEGNVIDYVIIKRKGSSVD